MNMYRFRFIFTGLMLAISTLFSCEKDKAPETVTDIDGNVYKTVKIGTQTWMAENLKTTKLNDGTAIVNIELPSTWGNAQLVDPMMCYYNNDPANKDKYGALYNWYAVKTGKLAPQGWHVATFNDWETLQDYLTNNGYDYNGTTGKLTIAKSMASTSGWLADATPGNVGNDQQSNNKSGFNALPAGYRNTDGVYKAIDYQTPFWLDDSSGPSGIVIMNSADFVPGFVNSSNPKYGNYIRCVKD